MMYVILVRVHYRAFMDEGSEYIDPHEDPYHEDAPRRSFDHLSKRDIKRLIARGIIAPDDNWDSADQKVAGSLKDSNNKGD